MMSYQATPPSPGRRSVHFAAGDDDVSDLMDSIRPSDHSGLEFAATGDEEFFPSDLKDSSRSTGSGSRKSLNAGESLRSALMRTHKNRDPLFYYEVLNVVGAGSMGSVAKVRKRDEAVGGSARKEIVELLQERNGCFLFSFFRFCMKGNGSANGSRSDGSQSGAFPRKRGDLFQPTVSARTDPTEVSCSGDEESTSTKRSQSNIVYAMKTIHLKRIKNEAFVQELKNEIEILTQLDHPHIVRPIETFYHRNQIFVIMELCSGGDLYSREPYSEENAARIVSSVLSAVAYMHSNNIAHRDLKFENILFVNKSPHAEVKLIDFGLSKTYIGGQKFTDGVGTILTMAPEVIKGDYTQSADLWSIGVIAFMLLTGQVPFCGSNRLRIVEQIVSGQYKFRGRRAKRISRQAKKFVEDLLVLVPEDRPTAEEALSSMWLNRRHCVTARAPTLDEVEQTDKSLKAFVGYSKLKKLSLMVIAHKSTTEEIGILRKLFQKYDTEKNGVLSFDEFKQAMSTKGYSEDEMQDLFDAVDLDGTGKIRYTEFLAATIEAQGAISEDRLAEAFDRLDSDDSGYIDAANLIDMLGEEFPKDEIHAIIDEADISRDNRISYSEFLALWEEKNEVRREAMLQEISVHSDISDEVSAFTESRDELDLEADAMARANYIQGKHLSGRKISAITSQA